MGERPWTLFVTRTNSVEVSSTVPRHPPPHPSINWTELQLGISTINHNPVLNKSGNPLEPESVDIIQILMHNAAAMKKQRKFLAVYQSTLNHSIGSSSTSGSHWAEDWPVDR
jgi:hypothetical protein